METSVTIISAPEALVSEGIATNALEVALGPRPFDVVADVLAGLDLTFDPSEAHEVHAADVDLGAAATNAAFMLHKDGATTEEAEDYLCEFALESKAKAARVVGFLTDPSPRAYISTYMDGRRLCRDFAGRAPENFTRLLTEQLTSADLLA